MWGIINISNIDRPGLSLPCPEHHLHCQLRKVERAVAKVAGWYCWWNQVPMERRARSTGVVEGRMAELATNMPALEISSARHRGVHVGPELAEHATVKVNHAHTEDEAQHAEQEVDHPHRVWLQETGVEPARGGVHRQDRDLHLAEEPVVPRIGWHLVLLPVGEREVLHPVLQAVEQVEGGGLGAVQIWAV